jgi:hypothetical protein
MKRVPPNMRIRSGRERAAPSDRFALTQAAVIDTAAMN